MDPLEVHLLLLSMMINLFFLKGQVSSSLLEFEFLLFDQIFETLDLFIVLGHSLLQLHVTSALLKLNVRLECLDSRLNRVKGNFLDQDLLRQGNTWLLLSFLIGLFVLVLHAETCKCTIDTNREELAVVIVQAHSLDLLRVSLYLQDLLHGIVCVTENLNRAGSVWLRETCVKQTALVANQNLRIGQIFLVAEHFLRYRILSLPIHRDFADTATTRSIDVWFHGTLTISLLTIRLEARNRAELDLGGQLETPRWANLASCRVQLPDINRRILAASDKPCIIVQPVDPFDRLIVADELEVLRDRCRIELVDPNLLVVLAGEEMTTVGEDNLATLSNIQLLVSD